MDTVQSLTPDWIVILLAFVVVAAVSGAMVLAWKAMTCLTTVTRADSRERDRERHDYLTIIKHFAEDVRVESQERLQLQLRHAQERMDAARLNTAMESNADDGLVRDPVTGDRTVPSMGYQ